MKPISYVRTLQGVLAFTGLLGTQVGAEAQSHPRVSPDGSRVAHFQFDLEAETADILVTDLETGETSRQPTGQSWSVNPAWSPEGDRLTFIGGPRGMSDIWDVYEVRLGDNSVGALTQTPEREMHTQISPSGDRIAFVRVTQGPHVWILDRGDPVARQLTTGPGRDFHPKWAPDGLSLVFDRTDGAGQSRIIQVSATDGAETVMAEAPETGRIGLPNVAPSGEVYAIVSTGVQSSLVRLEARGVPDAVLRSGPGERFGAFDFHPDGRSVFLSVTDGDDQTRLYRVEVETGARSLVHE
ncbi:TolB family protein [Maricaulis maris]|uniref:TolB family protein n=1 Tax=Maricaulis maris TaxID=74318 RepID=UPI003B8D6C83